MKLKVYLSTLKRGEIRLLAEKINVSQSFLSQMASGLCAISPKRCVEIELVTYGKVSHKDLRPDDWHKIWPELIAA